MYQEMVEYIVAGLVENPDDVSVTVQEKGSTILIEVSVAEDDTGRVIGRRGKVINAISTILQVRGDIDGKRISIDLI
ncbi:MAG: KH domain-containing protein [Chloroflexota bacterium]